MFPLIGLLLIAGDDPRAQRSREKVPVPVFPIAVRWRAPLPGGPSAPAVADRHQVLIPLRAGRLLSLALASGFERWSTGIATSLRPAVGDGLVFVAAVDGLVALDAADGTVRWRLALGALAAPPTWREGWLVAGLADGTVVAIRATDGAVLWRRGVGRLSAAATIDGDRLFLPLDTGRVSAAALVDGAEQWTRPLAGAPGPILPDGDRIFVGARDNFFYCLDATDGDLRWRWRTGADVIGAAALDEERVYFVSLDNVLRALDRANGAQRWRRPLALRPLEGPQYAAGRLIISGLSASVPMFAARDGAPAGEWSAAAELGAPVVVLDQTLDEGTGITLVAIAGAITGEWIAVGVGAAMDLPLEPLSVVPGTPLPPEGPPARP